MSELATYLGCVPQTINADSVALALGVRVTRESSNLFVVQDATARGDMVTLATALANGAGIASAVGQVPALSTVPTNTADLAYTAASGQFTNVSTNAVLMGRWVQGAPASGTLGVVELFTVA
jgi:hypothetical protein